MSIKRILIIGFLVVLITGVAYIKAIYSNQDRQLDAKNQAIHDSLLVQQAIEKSRLAQTHSLDSLRQFYIDSIYNALADPNNAANKTVALKSDSIINENDRLKKELEEANSTIANLKRSKEKQVERLVLSFYDTEMTGLPNDLSDYERNVSVKEIKEKIKKYFNLSSDSLQRILKNRK